MENLTIGTTYQHFDKYHKLAERLGVESLKSIVLLITDKDQILNALKLPEKALNSIPLHKWDRLDGHVRNLVRQSGGGAWSLSDTVCVLKHVAIYHVAGAAFEGVCTFCKKPFERRDGVGGGSICKECM